MPKVRPKVNGSLDRFEPGFKVSTFVSEFRKKKDKNGDRILTVGPTFDNTSAIEARIQAAKLNERRPYNQRIRVVNS